MTFVHDLGTIKLRGVPGSHYDFGNDGGQVSYLTVFIRRCGSSLEKKDMANLDLERFASGQYPRVIM